MLRSGEATAKGGHAFQRLLMLAETRDSDQVGRVALFLSATFNGEAFPFDRFELRAVDEAIRDECCCASLRAALGAQLLVDIDLAFLCSPAERFERYDQDERREYAWVPGFRYREARAQVPTGFVDRPWRHQGVHAIALFEAQARINLTAALSRLAQRTRAAIRRWPARARGGRRPGGQGRTLVPRRRYSGPPPAHRRAASRR